MKKTRAKIFILMICRNTSIAWALSPSLSLFLPLALHRFYVNGQSANWQLFACFVYAGDRRSEIRRRAANSERRRRNVFMTRRNLNKLWMQKNMFQTLFRSLRWFFPHSPTLPRSPLSSLFPLLSFSHRQFNCLISNRFVLAILWLK